MQASAGRSRGGCRTCRQDHVKCDEQRPVCARCKKRRQTCDYGVKLIWLEESIAKGQCHGRGAQHRRTASIEEQSDRAATQCYPSGVYFLNTITAEIERHMLPAGLERKLIGYSEEASVSGLYPQPSLSSPMAHYNENLVSFYDQVICTTSTFVDSIEDNPFRGVLMPLALRFPAVFDAVQAVSARVLTLRDPSFHDTALQLYSTSLRNLVVTIDRLTESESGLQEARALSLLLCWFEVGVRTLAKLPQNATSLTTKQISNDSKGKWVSHFTGLMHLLVPCKFSLSAAFSSFFVDYFLFHFVIARTVSTLDDLSLTFQSQMQQPKPGVDASGLMKSLDVGDSRFPAPLPSLEDLLLPSSPSKMTTILSQWVEDRDLDEINTYKGLSDGLLLLINQIADLDCPANKEDIPKRHQDALALKAALERLQQRPPLHLNPLTYQQISASAEIYRLASLLYLHHKVALIRSRITTRTSALTPLYSEPEVRDLLDCLLETFEATPDLTKLAAIPLWPLFIAGCSAEAEDSRVRVLSIFACAESHVRFGNVPTTRRVVEQVWRERDLGVDEPVLPVRKYKRTAGVVESSGGGRKDSRCVWQCIVDIMAGDRGSLT